MTVLQFCVVWSNLCLLVSSKEEKKGSRIKTGTCSGLDPKKASALGKVTMLSFFFSIVQQDI